MSENVYNYKIFTMTVSCTFTDCTFNLINIGKYLVIDETILGIKYNYGDTSILKGVYITSNYKKSKTKSMKKVNTVLFYNQVSLIIKTLNNTINVKLFANGSLHLTGVNSTQEPLIVMKLLYDKLIKLKDKMITILLTSNLNGILLDNNNLVYSENKEKYVVGFNKDNKYIINKKTYLIDFYTGYFITEKIETKRTRNILNCNGECIGYTKIELLKNKLKFYKKNTNIYFDYKIETNEINPYYFIYYDNSEYSCIIGKVVYYINSVNVNVINNNRIMECNYNCNPFKTENDKNFKFDVNCINIYFSLEFELNRNRLFEKLLQEKYICDLKSEKYPGLKFVYKKSINENNDGKCICDTKCTCTNITFSIFQSGNVNVFGFKSEEDINNVLNHFKILIDRYKEIIKKRIF